MHGDGDDMDNMISMEMTMFFLILTGFAVRRLWLVGDRGKEGITDLVVNLILPCNIIKSFLIEFNTKILHSFLSILLISMFLQFGCILLAKLLYGKMQTDRSKSLQFGIICSNAGFLGNPVAEGVYGQMGLALASIYLIPQRIVMWSEGLAIFSKEIDKKQILKKVLLHPCIIACEIGLLLMLTQCPLPTVVKTFVGNLGDCNTILSMLVIGMIVSDIRLKEILDRDIIIYTVIRLLIIPALVYLPCTWLGLPEKVVGVSTLLAGMPAGATTSMLALKYHSDEKFATNLVIFSTAVSVLTIPLWARIL